MSFGQLDGRSVSHWFIDRLDRYLVGRLIDVVQNKQTSPLHAFQYSPLVEVGKAMIQVVQVVRLLRMVKLGLQLVRLVQVVDVVLFNEIKSSHSVASIGSASH